MFNTKHIIVNLKSVYTMQLKELTTEKTWGATTFMPHLRDNSVNWFKNVK